MTSDRRPGGPAGPAGPTTTVGTAGRWQVLMVCTGNLCRSPMAQYLAAAALRTDQDPAAQWVTIISAGTHASEGSPMHPHAAVVLAERGLDPRGFAGRRLGADMINNAGLVLCTQREHRAAVVTMMPKAVRRTFTLRELARLTAGMTPADIVANAAATRGPATRDVATSRTTGDPTVADRGVRYGDALAACAVGRRGRTLPGHPTDDDIIDPLGGSIEAFRQCADKINDALARPLELLTRAVHMTG